MAITNAENSYQDFAYTAKIQTFTIPQDGIYLLEVWGAAGGNGARESISCSGGKGGYSKGYKEFKKGTILYIVIGGAGVSKANVSTETSAYNGGGTIYPINSTWRYDGNGGGGGGATHIATRTGLLSALSGYKSNILIVAGGGGGAGCGFWETEDHGVIVATGGDGGGTTGGKGVGNVGYAKGGLGGTQSAGGVSRGGDSAWSGSFGQGARDDDYAQFSGHCGTGGGGYYGGGSGGVSYGAAGGGGGSGYIGGVPSFSKDGKTYSPSMTNGSQSGNGKAKITYIKAAGIYNLYHGSTQIKSISGKSVTDVKVNNTIVFKN